MRNRRSTARVTTSVRRSAFSGRARGSLRARCRTWAGRVVGRLLDLFEGRRQLIVYRFFVEPGVAGWPEGGCVGCSMMADQVAQVAHLNARDTTLA
jgi:uncharacterized protein DUF899